MLHPLIVDDPRLSCDTKSKHSYVAYYSGKFENREAVTDSIDAGGMRTYFSEQ